MKSKIEYLSKKWQLNNLRPLVKSEFTNNYVTLAYSSYYNQDVVLKILLSYTHEPEVLSIFNGNGYVKLLDYEPDSRAFLLEYINPGISLKTLFPKDDVKAVEITSEIIKTLHAHNVVFEPNCFRTVDQLFKLLDIFQSDQIPGLLLVKARVLAKKLLSLKQELYLLHGDLHHDNILLNSNNEWIAIDPQGVVGPLEYEVVRFIMNPIPDLLQEDNVLEIVKNRIDRFSNIFGFEKKRLINWTFAQAVLSACWTEQNGTIQFFNYFTNFAKIIEKICE